MNSEFTTTCAMGLRCNRRGNEANWIDSWGPSASSPRRLLRFLDLMQRLFAITALTWKAAFRFRLFWVLAGSLLCSVIFAPADQGRRHGARFYPDHAHLYAERDHRAARVLHALAGVRHTRAGHRGLLDADGRGEADRALAILARQMARHPAR